MSAAGAGGAGAGAARRSEGVAGAEGAGCAAGLAPGFLFHCAAKFPDARAALEAAGGVDVGEDGELPARVAKCAVVWDSVKVIPWESLSRGVIVNHFQRMHEVGRKSNLCRHLRNLVLQPAAATAEVGSWEGFHARCWLASNATELHWFIQDFVAQQAMRVIKAAADATAVAPAVVTQALARWTTFGDAMARLRKQRFVGAIRASDEASVAELATYNAALSTAATGDSAGLSPAQVEAVRQAAESDVEIDNIWIVKPAHLSKGQGIRCFRDLDAVLDYASETEFKVVVQRYITRPLCIRRKKVDVRQWVLVTNLNPVTIWFFRSAYVRFCATAYDLDDLKDRFAHLANRSVAVHSAEYAADGEAAVRDDREVDEDTVAGNMWSSNQLRAYLFQTYGSDVWTARVVPQMVAIAKATVQATFARVKRLQNGFEWLGLDFLIEDESRNFHTRLLEANVSPDITHTTAVLRRMVPAAHTALVREVLRCGDDGSSERTVPAAPELDLNAAVDSIKLHDGDLHWDNVFVGEELEAAAVKRLSDQQTRLIKQQSRVAMLRVGGKRCRNGADVVKAWRSTAS